MYVKHRAPPRRLGDIPEATIVASGHSFVFYYIHTDHLHTPRQATLPSNNTQMWTWFSDPFGTTAENQNPQDNGTFNYPPRFPGQVSSTQVAGLYQNGFRDYDPQTGRYLESDPIGLRGGIDTYAYVGDNPVSGSDANGLEVRWSGSINSIGAGAKAGPLGEFLADATGSHSSTEFIDPWDECPSPEAANGVAWVSGINAVPGIGGTFLGKLNLGWLRGQAPIAEGPAYGFDISIQSGIGASAVTSVQKTVVVSDMHRNRFNRLL